MMWNNYGEPMKQSLYIIGSRIKYKIFILINSIAIKKDVEKKVSHTLAI